MPITKPPRKTAKTSKPVASAVVHEIPTFKQLRTAAKAVYGDKAPASSVLPEETASQKAHKTARWARIMTKWLIAHSSKGGVKWQVVSFNGSAGAESKGIVDMIAIRKNHRPADVVVPVGDLFEIILIQVKGGGATFPSERDVERMQAVQLHHRADKIVLAEWKKGEALNFYVLPNMRTPVSAASIFGKVPSAKQLASAPAKALNAQN